MKFTFALFCMAFLFSCDNSTDTQPTTQTINNKFAGTWNLHAFKHPSFAAPNPGETEMKVTFLTDSTFNIQSGMENFTNENYQYQETVDTNRFLINQNSTNKGWVRYLTPAKDSIEGIYADDAKSFGFQFRAKRKP